MATASVLRCGMAPWPPEPLISISKASEAAIMGPAFVAATPNSSPGHRCSAKIWRTSSATPSSTIALLGRLEDELHGAAQPFAQVVLAESASGADEHARVPVVAAGMHLPVYLRGERKIRTLVDRQSVH